MKKIKKYNQQESTNSLASKIASYSALAGAMMAAAPGAMAQCGTAGSATAALDVDINGDGITDVTINWGNSNTSLGLNFTQISPFTFIPIVPPGGTASFPVPLQFNSVTNFSWANGYSLSNSVSATFNPFASVVAGPFPGPYGGPTGGGCYTLFGYGVTAGQPVSFPTTFNGPNAAVFAGFSSSYLYLIQAVSQGIYYSLNANFAYAQAGAGNQIIGLSAAGAGVCSVTSGGATIGGVPASNSVGLGTNSTVNSSFKTFSAYAFTGGDVYFFANVPLNGSSCGGALPPIYNAVVNFGYADIPTYGTFFNLLGSGTGIVSANPNVNTTTHLAVQFTAASGETHNGWVEVSIDPATSEVTCLSTGYQECSIEAATAAGDPTAACIAVGEATNESAACMAEPPADIPTVGEWGLIMLGLLMSITAIVGIRQRREEEAIA